MALSAILQHIGRVVGSLVTEVDQLAVLVDLVVEVADLVEGITKIPAWRHPKSPIRGAHAKLAADGLGPIDGIGQ
jgi:hypothetical protein